MNPNNAIAEKLHSTFKFQFICHQNLPGVHLPRSVSAVPGIESFFSFHYVENLISSAFKAKHPFRLVVIEGNVGEILKCETGKIFDTKTLAVEVLMKSFSPKFN